MESDLQHESLSEEIKVRLTTSQLRSLEEVARNSASKPSSYARFILHEFLMTNDPEYKASHKERKPYGNSSNTRSSSTTIVARKNPAKAKRGHLRDIREVSCPILANIPAGWPDDRSTVKPKREIMIAKGRFPEGVFGLDVNGNSMNAAKGPLGPILDGQTVVLLPPDLREPKHGDIVAALCDGQTTLKRLNAKADPPTLHAESTNPGFANDIIPAHDLSIQGVVIEKL